MIKKFNVKVNGNSYEVEVEEIKDGSQVSRLAVQRPAMQAAAPAPAPSAPPVSAPKTAAPAASGAGSVTSPMPGTILDIMVKEGDIVKAGQVCVILEAMKMENELPAPCDGTVKSVNVTKGASVNTSDVLVVIG